MKVSSIATLCLILPLLTGGAYAGDVLEEIAESQVDKPAKLYRSPSERREAGLGRKVTDWLGVSGLAEVEAEYQDFDFSGNKSDKSDYMTTKTLQLGLNFTLTEEIAAEFVFEYEVDSDHSLLDEGFLQYEGEMLGVEAGRLYIPFGEFYSHFATGPILEFGETRGNALVVDYALSDSVDVFAYGIDGKAERQGESGGQIDWGGGFEFASADESVKISAGYFSDMADTDEELLEDFNGNYRHRVGGITANTLVGRETFEFTAEYLGALRSFSELDSEEDRPWAANVEVAWFPLNNFQLAGRIEASGEIPDEPELQLGVSATWLIGNRFNISVDYLHGKFRDDFVFDDDDNEINSRQLVAAQLSFEF
ncbi:MAG: LbtU family siderophore porin [Pseudomonadota bacterium]